MVDVINLTSPGSERIYHCDACVIHCAGNFGGLLRRGGAQVGGKLGENPHVCKNGVRILKVLFRLISRKRDLDSCLFACGRRKIGREIRTRKKACGIVNI
jgi:hypothetical protein